ncbi:MAG TPA: ImmA/IrrE family metallo-endopeptidase [Bacteroidia bacterium]|nr:ImmA/IrrE family metallo-endopeptidase [Bacteroidia bacterium]
MESSTAKGNRLEDQVFDLISKMLKNDDFIVPQKTSKIFKKKGYHSAKRGKDIIFDVTIETTLPGADRYSLLTVIECKNLNKNVTVDDVEEFGSKINQVGEHNTKGIIVTTRSYQESALTIAHKEGIGLVRLTSPKELQWVNYRRYSNRISDFDNTIELTDNNYKKEPFIGKVGNKRITNFADLLLQYSIIDYFKDSEEFIDIPFITDERINEIVNKLYDYDLYNRHSLNFDKLIPFLEERYHVKFLLDTIENDNYLGKIEFNPLCIKISKDARIDLNRWRFTLAHEIGHLILHSKLLRDRLIQKEDDAHTLSLKYSSSKSNSDRLEIQANLFASNLLLPEKILVPRMDLIFAEYRFHRRRLYLDYQPVNQHEVYEILYKLSDEFHVSIEALKIRLIKLNLMIDETDTRISTMLRRIKF